MNTPSNDPEKWDELRARIIGFGEKAISKSYYPELLKKIDLLEKSNRLIKDAIFSVNEERKRASRSEQEVSRMFRSSPDLIAVIMLEGYRFIEISDSWTGFIHKTREQVVGKHIDEVLTWSTDEDRAIVIDSLKSQKEVHNREIHLKKLSEDLFTGLLSITILDFNGKTSMLLTITDITWRKQVEIALRESEERYRKLVETSPEAITLTDLDGKIISCNSQALFLHGADSYTDLVGKNLVDLIASHDRKRAQGDQATLLKTNILTSIEYMMLRIDGTIFPGELSASVILDQNGTPKAMMALTRDISERKSSENALRESEEKFRQLFENMEEGVAIHQMVYNENGDAIDYRILDINPSYEKQTGLSRKTIHGKLGSQAYLTGYPPYLEIYSNVAKTGVAHHFETYFEPLNKHFHISAISPKPGFFATVFTDYTDIKKTEKALKESGRKFQLLFELAAVGFAQIDVETTRFVRINKKFMQLMGFSQHELYQKTLGELVCDTNDRKELKVMIRDLKTGLREMVNRELRCIRSDGREIWVNCTLSPMWYSGDTSEFIIAVMEDVTDRKNKEQELAERNAERERFTYMISHDLKTPLITIGSYIGYLREDIIIGDQKNLDIDMGYIVNAVKKMGVLLDDLLEFSRIGFLVRKKEEIVIKDVVHDALTLIAGNNNVEHVRIIVHENLRIFKGDKLRVVEVFQNLIDNAAKYMGNQKDPIIEIGVEKT